MTEHLSPGTAYRLFRGRLSADERERLLRHLMACPLCQGMSPARVEKQGPPVSPGTELDRAFETAFAAALAAENALAESRAHKAEDLRQSGFGSGATFDLVAKLIDTSRSYRYSDPQLMVKSAGLAVAATEKLSLDRYSRELILDQRAWALAELANAYRVAEDLPRAYGTMLRALRWLREGTGDLLVRARVVDLLASLLAAQRRLSEAIRLTRYLAGLYQQLGDKHLAGRALISMGVFLGTNARPEEGLSSVLKGLASIEREREPGLLENSFLTVLNLMAEAGLFSQARRTAWRYRVANILPTDRLSKLRLRWIEGKIHMGLDNPSRAEEAFLEARDGFIQADLLYTPALVGLDLATLWVQQQQRQRVLPLLEEMLEAFRHLGIVREAFIVLLVLRNALQLPDESTERLCCRIGLVATLLPKFEPQPAPTVHR